METIELSMKLLINKKTGKLCFAEVGSDVVEFLTGLLSLPLGTITSLLAKEDMAGSVGTLVGSVEKLGENYNSEERHVIPVVPAATVSRLQQLLGVQLNGNGQLFTCQAMVGNHLSMRYNCGYLSAIRGSACPSCGKGMNGGMTLAGVGSDGPVEGVAAATTKLPTPMYTLKDDMSVTPAASLSTIALLAQCGVKDLSVLQEKTVKIGKEEALGILAAAFKSKTVLTDVFMPKKNAGGKRGAPEDVKPRKNARCKTEPPEEVIQI